MNARILVVDDDAAFRGLLVDILAGDGHHALEAGNGEQALLILARENVDLVLTDQRMPGLDGLELLRRLRAAADPPAVVVMTGFGTIPQAVEAVRLGAADYLTKPLDSPAALRSLVRRVLGDRAERRESADDFLTRDPATLEMLALADRAAATDSTVLITGPSGTGKELLARRLHHRSRRAARPFVAVNCGAIPATLAASELFGHEKGAFTGADARRPGRFEQADTGTLFLDEVGELPEEVQSTLLRVLEDRQVQRVGGARPLAVDVRLLAATNRDLGRAVAEGRFRADLYYRLAVVTLEISPLAARSNDLEVLVPALLELLAGRLGLPRRRLSAAAMARLQAHSWPGNVRELRNVLERALIVAAGDEIAADDLALREAVAEAPGGRRDAAFPAVETPGPMALADRERQAILDALERTGGHREQAAELLGISVRTLYNRLRQYGLR